MNISIKYLIIQFILVTTAAGNSFGESSNISGAVQDQPDSVINHISGRVFLRNGEPSVKAHVSGKKKALSIHDNIILNSKVDKKDSIKNWTKKRKLCWASCESIWKVDVQEECSSLKEPLKKYCEKKFFDARLTCVSQNCKENLK